MSFNHWIIKIFSIYFLVINLSFANFSFIKDNNLYQKVKQSSTVVSKDEFSRLMMIHQDWSEILRDGAGDYKITYTFNDKLEHFIKSQLQLYRPDYSSVVVIQNKTGEVLSAVDYSRAQKSFGRDLSFSNTHPAASIFKIVTAADLLENTSIEVDTQFRYIGRSTTLYKYQLQEPKSRFRFQKKLNLRKAFATSNNVVFGRSAIENLSSEGLKKMAEKFGFNRNLLFGGKLAPSVFKQASDDYNLAEFSSGLNRQTLMSPVHGAVIASIVANDGVLRFPKIIKKIQYVESNKVFFPPVQKDEVVLTPKTSDDLKLLFQETIKKGTARSSFRRNKKLLKSLEIGGKTGTLTGGKPYGRRDWFVSYAKPKDDPVDPGISICVMIVNKKKWYVKSSFIAKNIMDFYYLNFKK